MSTLKDILVEMKDQSPESKALVEKAYHFAEKAHAGQKRLSGEPYFSHLTATACNLAKIGMDVSTVIAGLLHDTVEDTKITTEEIEKEFGAEVKFMVEGVTKLGELKYRGFEQRAESLRRLLVATAKDVRVIIVKLYDRLHNMQTNSFHEPERQKRKALETLEIYAPLADRLGMGKMKSELEDLAFISIDPDAYQHAVEVRKLKTRETEIGLARVQKDLQHALARKEMRDFRTEIRIKGLWSLHQKLKRKNDDITEIHDIAALRVIVPTVDDCYTALGVAHALWRPLPGEFKDYISFPKPNGYQSLHTTVVTPDAGVVEIQIRDEEMHQRAQFGIASHMSYKQLGKTAGKEVSHGLSFSWMRMLLPSLLKISKKKEEEKKTEGVTETPHWLSELADTHMSFSASTEFVEGLKEDFFSHRVFVFTPGGDVIDLPSKSTPIDFAYAIHSDLGNHMQGAKVKGKLASFDTVLRNGDIVEIIKKESAHPTSKWLDYAKTSMARKQIRAYLEAHERGNPNLPVRTDSRQERKKKKTKPKR